MTLPLLGLIFISGVLCWFHSRLGRSIYAITIGLGIISVLGPPPPILSSAAAFTATIQGASDVMALSLMYWSPLREKFEAD